MAGRPGGRSNDGCFVLLLLCLSPLAYVRAAMVQQQYLIPEVNPMVWNYWVGPQQDPMFLAAQLYTCPDLGFTLIAINEFRARHDAQPLLWDNDLADAAKRHLNETLACTSQDNPLPTKSTDPLVPDAYGIGYMGVDLKATFKCVSAINSWYYTSDEVDYSFRSEVNTETEEFATLLWNSTERLGCALQACGDSWMNVYCFFDPQNGTFADTELLKENVGSPQAECPSVYRTAWNDTMQSVAKKHGMSPETIICHNQQGSVATFSPGEGFLVTIPCKDAPLQFAGNRCPEVDKLAGLSEGYCPSVHFVVPGQEDTSEVARVANEAAHKLQTSATNAMNFTYTYDNVCSYNAVNNVTNFYDYCHTIPPLQGTTSAMFLPCGETVMETSQGGFFQDAGAYNCPDQEEFMHVLNQYRAKHDLLPLVWNDEFGQEIGDYFDNHYEQLCPDFGSNFNYNMTFDMEAPTIGSNMLITYVLWGPAAVNTACLPWTSFYYGLLNEIQYYYTTLGEEMAATLLQTGSALFTPVVFSNDTSNMACRILVCDSRKSYVSCTFDTPMLGPVDNVTGFPTLNSQSQWLSVFDNQKASCPSAYFPKPVDTLESVADKFNVTVEALMCWNNQLPNPEEFRMWYAIPQPIGIPCMEDVEPWLENCTALAVLEGHCNFTYTVQPGQRIQGVVNRFSTADRNFTAEQLCCYNNMERGCDVNFLQKLRIPCEVDLPALENCVAGSVDVCRRPYVVQKEDSIPSLASTAGIEDMSLCCYWGYSNLLDCEIPEPGVVVELPCFEDLDARGCMYNSTEGGSTTTVVVNNTTEGGGISTGAIVGVAVGVGVGVMLLIAAAGALIIFRRRQIARRPVVEDPEIMAAATKGMDKDMWFKAQTFDWSVKPEELEIEKRADGSFFEIGSGAFATVFKAKFHGGTYVAVKELKNSFETKGQLETFVKEVSILKSCRSPFIVQFLGAYVSKEKTMIITELMQGGSLDKQINNGAVNWYKRGQRIALDIAQGLNYLHSRNVLHLDIKSGNILLTGGGQGKIADVGLAQILQSTYAQSAVAMQGTWAWMAPEVVTGTKISSKSDVYSFGVLLWEIVCGEMPTRGHLRDTHVPDECPQEVAALVKQCTSTNADNRPTMQEIIVKLRKLGAPSRTASAALSSSASSLQQKESLPRALGDSSKESETHETVSGKSSTASDQKSSTVSEVSHVSSAAKSDVSQAAATNVTPEVSTAGGTSTRDVSFATYGERSHANSQPNPTSYGTYVERSHGTAGTSSMGSDKPLMRPRTP